MIDEYTLLMGIYTFSWWYYLHALLYVILGTVLSDALAAGSFSDDKMVPSKRLDRS